MFNNDITLAGDSSSTRTYALRGVTDGNSIRSNASAPTSAPEAMLIKNQTSSRGGVALNRTLVRLDLTKINTPGVPLTGSVYVTFEVPQDPVWTVAIIKDMRTQLVNFLTTAGNVEKLLNGEP